MTVLPVIGCLMLASCFAGPINQEENLVVTDKFFINDFVLYTAEHDIVKLFVPFNQFKFDDDSSSSSSSSSEEMIQQYTIFFVEADVQDGKTTEQGLYVLKNGKATKLLDNGRDATATNENVVYFGASDGIYIYNEAANKAEKYGAITDNIIQLAHSKKTNVLYYLTDNHEVYKLNSDANTSVKLPLEDVQSVVFDFVDNMYYYDSNKDVILIKSGENVSRKYRGLPSDKNEVTLLSAMYGAEGEALFVVDGKLYFLAGNGPYTETTLKVETKITAAAPQPTLIQFYAKDKKIYEFNMITILSSKIVEELQEFLEEHKGVINAMKKEWKF